MSVGVLTPRWRIPMRKSVPDEKMDDDILRVLNEVEDPELRIGMVDMGLIYRAEWTVTGIEVDVTTTVSSCPFAASLCEQIDIILRERFREALGVKVQLVFDPPWALDRLSSNARQILGWDPSNTSETIALRCWEPIGVRKH